jgi:hypothetical protein
MAIQPTLQQADQQTHQVAMLAVMRLPSGSKKTR